MDENQALQLLDQAVSQLSANREVHVKLQQAVEILREFINKNTAKEEKKS